jgi:hypothetical protein
MFEAILLILPVPFILIWGSGPLVHWISLALLLICIGIILVSLSQEDFSTCCARLGLCMITGKQGDVGFAQLCRSCSDAGDKPEPRVFY